MQLCEIEDFVETHICLLCSTLRSRLILGVCVLIKDIDLATSLRTSLYQSQQGDVNQSVLRNYETRFGGGHNLTAVECTSLLCTQYASFPFGPSGCGWIQISGGALS